jgi:hypothetical protein
MNLCRPEEIPFSMGLIDRGPAQEASRTAGEQRLRLIRPVNPARGQLVAPITPIPTATSNVLIIEPQLFCDERGLPAGRVERTRLSPLRRPRAQVIADIRPLGPRRAERRQPPPPVGPTGLPGASGQHRLSLASPFHPGRG